MFCQAAVVAAAEVTTVQTDQTRTPLAEWFEMVVDLQAEQVCCLAERQPERSAVVVHYHRRLIY